MDDDVGAPPTWLPPLPPPGGGDGGGCGEWSVQSDEYADTVARLGHVQFSVGQPSRDLMPLALMREAAAHRFADGGDPTMLQYGQVRGYTGFLRALSGFLEREQGHPVPVEELFLTPGNSGALAHVCAVLCPLGGVVYTEEATYFLARAIFEQAGLRLRGIACDDRGMLMPALEAAIEEHGVPELVYTIPTFQNPSGAVLPHERRERLVDLAEKHGFMIVADDPYALLHLDEPRPPPPLPHYDRSRGRVVSLGSFSKILAPGLRVGWAQAEPDVISALAAHPVLASGGAFNPVMAGILHSAIELGLLDRHLTFLRSAMRVKLRALCNALHAEVPELRFAQPLGGYFVWCSTPPGVDAEELLACCKQHDAQVDFFPGTSSAPRDDEAAALRGRLRLSFAFYKPQELEEGVRRLRDVLRAAAPPAEA
eukprot:NODE_4279_length_1911_cov_5.846973.p1 GENE.NODE_4279_length_1911_cov_5.846973~~NODE_4279_length_1911_cov_5.846973.p1  ORF type:complete len:450 (-),score=161.15 NODE_4279_length_1911_cov_5.846973:561-1835(-)